MALKNRYGHTDEHIADTILHKARSTVTELLRIADLPVDIRRECRDHAVKKSTLLRLARIGSSAQQQAAWEAIKNKTGRSRKPRIPPQVRPLVEFLDAGTKVVEALRNTNPAALADHVDQLESIQKLHQELGRLIRATRQKVERQAVSKQRAEQQSAPESQSDDISHQAPENADTAGA